MRRLEVNANTVNVNSSFVRLSPMGVLDNNDMIPFFAYFTGYFLKQGDERIFVYSPIVNFPWGTYGNDDLQGRRLFDYVRHGSATKCYVKTDRFFTHKHALYEVDENLNVDFIFLLAVERDYFFANRQLHRNLTDRSKFTILVNHKINNKEYSGIKRRFNNYYDLYFQGVDILFTDRINELCFKNNLKSVSFKSVIDRIEYINKIKSLSYGRPKKENDLLQDFAKASQPIPTGEGILSQVEATINNVTFTYTGTSTSNVFTLTDEGATTAGS